MSDAAAGRNESGEPLWPIMHACNHDLKSWGAIYLPCTASPWLTFLPIHGHLKDFVAEVVQLFFEDSVVKIERMSEIASSSVSPDFNELDQLVHQFKGSSASLGAQMLATLCIKLRECCQTQNQQGCISLLSQVR